MCEKKLLNFIPVNTLPFIFLLGLFASYALAGDDAGISHLAEQPVNTFLKYNQERFAMLQEAADEVKVEVKEDIKKKSGLKAAFFSAIVPGAGQFYTKNYWRAALYAGLEIALWSANIIYNNKGDDVDVRMRAYGDEHWSEWQYWSFLNYKASEQGLPYYPFDENNPNKLLIDFNPDVANDLRYLEGKLGYTHVLPSTKTQQYYEMIYKYLHQFGVGWDDVMDTFGDPFYYDGGDFTILTPNVATYRDLRNESNGYYDIANNMLMLILVNHVVSDIDAAIAAKKYNDGLQYSFQASAQRVAGRSVNMYGVVLTW